MIAMNDTATSVIGDKGVYGRGEIVTLCKDVMAMFLTARRGAFQRVHTYLPGATTGGNRPLHRLLLWVLRPPDWAPLVKAYIAEDSAKKAQHVENVAHAMFLALRYSKITTVAQLIEKLVAWKLPTAAKDADLNFDLRQRANCRILHSPGPSGAEEGEPSSFRQAEVTTGGRCEQ